MSRTQTQTDTNQQQNPGPQQTDRDMSQMRSRSSSPEKEQERRGRPGDSKARHRRKQQEAGGGGGGDDDPLSGDDGNDSEASSTHFTFTTGMSTRTHRTDDGDNPAEWKENKHVAKPPIFTGDNWDEFWPSVIDNIRANPKYFQKYRRRIEFVLSFFRGKAVAWKQNYLADPDNAVGDDYLDYPYNPDTDKLELPQEKTKTAVTEKDWFQFILQLKRDYETLDSRAQARRKITNYQQPETMSVADYFQKMDSWRRVAKWQGKAYDEMIVEKLKENLNQDIVDAIYRLPQMPVTYAQWKQEAIKWDNRDQTRELASQARKYNRRASSPGGFYRPASPGIYSPRPSAPPRSPTPMPRDPPPRTPSPTPFRSPSPARTSRAMLPDAEYERRKAAGECFGCGKKWEPGHRCGELKQRIRAAVHNLEDGDRAALLDTLQADFPKS